MHFDDTLLQAGPRHGELLGELRVIALQIFAQQFEGVAEEPCRSVVLLCELGFNHLGFAGLDLCDPKRLDEGTKLFETPARLPHWNPITQPSG